MQKQKIVSQKGPDWHKLPLQKVRELLSTDFERGLTASEAALRLKFHGLNKLPEGPRDTYLEILLRQIRSPLVYILLLAGFLSLALQDYADLAIILSVVVINLAVGFIQEHKANTTLSELRRAMRYQAAVLRDGVVFEIDAEYLVVGDIVRVSSGNRVPADLRLFDVMDLEVVEAELTGESVPALKQAKPLPADLPLADRDNMAFFGTEVVAGSAYGVVIATGLNTQVGGITRMLLDTEKQITPLQRSLQGFSHILAWGTLLLSFIVLVVGILYQQDFFTMLLTAVAVAVAAIPEGLPVSLTIILALGMRQILKKRGLVRHLASAETLGATSVICMDKTGTLTEGQMKLAALVTASEEFHHHPKISPALRGESLLRLLRIALLVNEAIVENAEKAPADWRIIGNSTDRALLIAAAEAGMLREELEKTHKLIDLLPFNEKRKFAASLRASPKDGDTIYVKGAAEIVLAMCDRAQIGSSIVAISHPAVSGLKSRLEAMTASGLRVLAIAHKRAAKATQHLTEPAVSSLVFDGFVGLRDPVRLEVAQTLLNARQAGLRPVIATGDHKLTALSVARDLNFEIAEDEVLTGQELDSMDDESLRIAAPKIKLYARVTPAHKLRVIGAWQELNEIVAMTGDGVNDAPALKKADIGMSLGSGTEVAKSASDLVLLDNNFTTIVAAIEQGRVIYENIRRVIVYLLSNTFSMAVLIVGTLFLGLPMPLLPAQILWSNIVTDGPPNLALTFEPGSPELMLKPPRKKSEGLISRKMRVIILFVGLLTDVLFLFLYLQLFFQVSLEQARTAVFAAFGFSSLLYAFSLKSLDSFIWRSRPFNNPSLIIAVLLCTGLQLAAIYWPPLQALLATVALPAWIWPWVLGLSAIKLVAIELTKVYFRLQRGKL